MDNLVFEIKWFWDNKIRYPFNVVKTGIKNLWIWFPVIWRDRWWDHMYLHNMLKFKLQTMVDNWDDSHYIGSEKDKEYLQELVDLLNTIEELNDFDDFQSFEMNDKEIDRCYQEFGRKLFDIQEVEKYNEKGEVENTYRTSRIRTLWD